MYHLVKIGLLVLAFLLVPPSTSMLGAASEGHGGDSKKSDKKEAGKAENGAIEIGPLVVNVLSSAGYRFLRLDMMVQCADNTAAERLTKSDAKEDLVLYLSNRLAEDLLTQSGKMILRKELLDLFSKYAGAGKVQNIYFLELVLQ